MLNMTMGIKVDEEHHIDMPVIICDSTYFKLLGMEIEEDRVLPGPFMRMDEGFEGAEDMGGYTVRSTDIDLGGHMNNAAYVRAIAGAFSTDEWKKMDPRELEIAYRSPCFEGETLRLQRRGTADGLELRLSRQGKTIALARII